MGISINREITNMLRRFIFTSTFRIARKSLSKYNQWGAFALSVVVFACINFFLFIFLSIVFAPLAVFALSITTTLFTAYWYKRLNKLKVIGNTRNSKYWSDKEFWLHLTGWDFEEEAADVFSKCGFQTKVTKGSGDGGVDIIMEKDGLRYIVQCKHHKNPVVPRDLRALWGVMDDFEADVAVMIASNGITTMGADFIANKPNFHIITLDQLIQMSQEPSVGGHVVSKQIKYDVQKAQDKYVPFIFASLILVMVMSILCLNGIGC